jgi:predicted flavoprotein YhiN
MKAAPLLRAWLHRLRAQGVQFHMRHRWLGWADGGALRFAASAGEVQVTARAVVLALGGGSWARLGSDGAWVPLLAQRGVAVAPLRPPTAALMCAWASGRRQGRAAARGAAQSAQPTRRNWPQRHQGLPITVTAPRPIDEAISTAGGVRFEALDAHLMLRALPGVFCAGEMLDWEAPTGGYLLTACWPAAAWRGRARWPAEGPAGRAPAGQEPGGGGR